MNYTNIPEIDVPVFKKHLKTSLMEKHTHDMKKKIFYYKITAIAAMIIMTVSLFGAGAMYFNSRRELAEAQQYVRLIEMSNDIDTAELERIIVNETINSGRPVYPVEIENSIVRRVMLNNNKQIIIESKIDNSSYALAY